MSGSNTQFLVNKNGNRLAYDYAGGAEPLCIFLSGFGSDMSGTKAQFLKQDCALRGQAYLLLDYSGHGQSGGDFLNGSIASWCMDALTIIDHVAKQHKVGLVIGSSMGGWIALHVALRRADFIKGLIGIASAPDFTRDILSQMNEAQIEAIESKGVFYEPSQYGGPVAISSALLKDSDSMCLLDADIDLTIPVTLMHGQQDQDVPWQKSERLAELLRKTSAETIFVPDGDHRLARAEDLSILKQAVLDMLTKMGY